MTMFDYAGLQRKLERLRKIFDSADLLMDDVILWVNQARPPRRPKPKPAPLRDALLGVLGDGEWHSYDTLANRMSTLLGRLITKSVVRNAVYKLKAALLGSRRRLVTDRAKGVRLSGKEDA